MSIEQLKESEPLITRHSKWLAKEAMELGKSALVAGIALPATYELLKLVNPEVAGYPMDPAVWGAVIGSDYMRRKLKRQN